MGLSTHRLRRTILEVERKFRCNPGTAHIIHTNQGTPPFQQFAFKGHKNFEDVYYDSKNLLSSRGIWVRKRDGIWQAKVRRGGDFTNSQFGELEGPESIRDMVESLDIGVPLTTANFGLTKIAKFETKRAVWSAAEMYEIAVDSTNFGHLVGEVELQQEVVTEWEEGLANRLDTQIEAFMKKHSWAFPSGKAVGKLSAYFDWAEGNGTDCY